MSFFFIRVDATNEAVYELVAEEQEEETVEHASEEVANPADLQGKPRSMTHKFSIYINVYLSICAFTF